MTFDKMKPKEIKRTSFSVSCLLQPKNTFINLPERSLPNLFFTSVTQPVYERFPPQKDNRSLHSQTTLLPPPLPPFQPKPSSNMPFQPSKDSGSNKPNLDMNLLVASSAFPSISARDDSSPSTNRRGHSSGSKMTRSELLSVLNTALALIDEDLDSCCGDSDSSSSDQ
jgi:hypothetical protein